ncbi:MAG TPA: hypothetical protein VGG49_05955 [Steroidobacteraceae bacterium]|jgi:hypothetical protein
MTRRPAANPAGGPQGRARGFALALGILALLWCLLLGRHAPRQALLSYLFAFLFCCGVSVGSLALLMVHVLTGGAWGDLIRPYLLAAARALPFLALLSLPLLFGEPLLYPWATPAALAHDALLRAQSWYLNPTFFTLRTIAYFAIWLLLLAQFQRRLEQPERLPRLAAPGLILYAITATLAAVDWAMSLLPHWHSTVFGLMVATGWTLSAAALAILCATWPRGAPATAPGLFKDLGNLLLALVLIWAYLAFMQYLTIWIADLPAETSWYLPRTLTSWREVAWLLIAFHFVVPFAVLLSRRAKQQRTGLAGVAALLLLAHWVDALWLIVPDFHPTGLALHWTDLAAPLGLGALWLCVFLGRLPVMEPAHG